VSTPVVFDCEVYKDYFLLMFRNVSNGKTVYFELYEGVTFPTSRVMGVLSQYQLISFNGRRFDMPLVMMACFGATCEEIKAACDAIITEKLNYWDDAFKARFPGAQYGKDQFDHIDLIEVAPGQASLKIYGGRLHSRRMQDLPIEPDASITPEMRQQLIDYCGNDLQTTIDLFHTLEPRLALRKTMSTYYGVDLRSKSDAQIAEQVIRGRVQRDSGQWVERPTIKAGTMFQYRKPAFVSFLTEPMRKALAIVEASNFYISATGNVEMPDELAKARIKMGTSVYRMGIGGLHSSEESVAHKAVGCRIIDRDVASYYPAIILKLGLFPAQMGDRFLGVYRDLVKRRLEAKRSGDKVRADSLKITINGSFGKFGSRWSTLYSPELLIQTTITGQLCLLMLIEMLEMDGISVVSANTDGIVMRCPTGLEDAMERCVWVWEQLTGFETEATEYEAIYSRDVNNYVALKRGGGEKLKGAFNLGEEPLAKNPTNNICIEAVVAFLKTGKPVEDTIIYCDDIRKFITIRKVNGGAVKDGVFLGKAVRWYYAHGVTGVIEYKTSGYAVARSEGGKPLMTLPDEFPGDVNHAWYIQEAKDILKSIGWKD
jgi:hypothetical protein